jgi:hypothetical protein
MSFKVSSRPPKESHHDLACGPLASNVWASSPMEAQAEISLIRLIKIFTTVLMLCLADLIHGGFLDAF